MQSRRIIASEPGVPGLEPINEPLYDTQTYPVAGVAQLVFFATGLGGRTLRETNVPIAGALPNPQQFHIYGAQLCPSMLATAQVATAAAMQRTVSDQAALIENSFFRLFIGTKSYIEVASVFVPNGHGLVGFAATTAGEIASATNGVAHQNNFYDVTVKVNRSRLAIHVPPQQNFRVTLEYPGPGATAVVTNVTIGGAATGGIPIRVFLLGIKWREVQ
jgi:hypothetical protein